MFLTFSTKSLHPRFDTDNTEQQITLLTMEDIFLTTLKLLACINSFVVLTELSFQQPNTTFHRKNNQLKLILNSCVC